MRAAGPTLTPSSSVDLPTSDDEEEICPLCCETLDLTDKNFFPCPCGYQVCLYCWNHIKSNLNGLCPACRTPYRDNPHDFAPVDRDELIRKKQEMKEKKRKERQERAKEAMHEEAKALAAAHTGDRSMLRNQRVVQRNLVYVIGLAPSIASEETLKRGEYFGQYGKIVKIAVNRTPPQGADPKGIVATSASAYVTFAHKEDALAAIHAVDNFTFDGRLIRASFGTTKYCNTYIRGGTCTNPECLFLHEPGNKEDTVTKEEIQAWQTKGLPGGVEPSQKVIVGGGGPSGTGRRPAHPIFPPPRFNPSALRSALGAPKVPVATTSAIPAIASSSSSQGGAAWQTLTPVVRSLSMGSEKDFPTPMQASPLSSSSSSSSTAAAPIVSRAHSTNSSLINSSPSPVTSAATPGLATPNRIVSPPGVLGAVGGNRKAGIIGPSSASSSTSTTPAAPPPLPLSERSSGSTSSSNNSSSSISISSALKPPPGMESMLVGSSRSTVTPTKGKATKQPGTDSPSLHPQHQPPLPRVPPPPGVTLDSLLSSPSLVPPSSTASPLLSAALSSGTSKPPMSFPSPPPPQPPVLMEDTSPWTPASSSSSQQQTTGEGSVFGPGGFLGSMSSSSQSIIPGSGGGDSLLQVPISSLSLGGGERSLLGGGRPSSSTDLFGSSSLAAPLLEAQGPGSGAMSRSSSSSYLGGISSGGAVGGNGSSSGNDSGGSGVLMGTGGLFSTIWAPEGPPAPSFPGWDSTINSSNHKQEGASPSSQNGGFSSGGGAGRSSSSGGLFPFPLMSTADSGERGGGSSSSAVSASADGDPFTLSESLARAIGMTLPDAPDSLAAQAARGRYGKKSASRYSFANDEGEAGMLGGGRRVDATQQQQQLRAAPHKQAPLSGLGPQPVPPSSQSFQSSAGAGSGVGLGGRGMFGSAGQAPQHMGGGTGRGLLDPSLQTGMAMLQQLLPNVNLTYGDNHPEECWTTSPPTYPSSTGSSSGGGSGHGAYGGVGSKAGGATGGGAVGSSSGSTTVGGSGVWSTAGLRSSYL